MSLRDITNAANDLSTLLESNAPKGLRHPRHAKHIRPARAKIKAVMVRFFERQRKAVLADVRPKIKRALLLHPVPFKEIHLGESSFRTKPFQWTTEDGTPIMEAISAGGKTFARSLMPTSLHPLTFSATAGETSEYNEAITGLIGAAAKSLGSEIGADFAGDYLRENSLSKLTGGLNETSIDRLQDALANAWDKGGAYSDMVDAITETFDDFSETRAELIAQTEANDAYSAARRETADALGLDEKRWSPDGEACPECQENADAGWIDIDEEFPSGDSEPTAHPGCFLGNTPVLAVGVSVAFRRWYEGPIRVLRFAGLPDLSVTPNHPILTRNGWVAAGKLQIGDDVAQCLRPTNAAQFTSGDPNLNEMESSIENVFDSVSMASGMPPASVPLSTEAFHGDVQPHAKVDIVRTASALDEQPFAKLATDSTRGQLAHQFRFSSSQQRRIALNTDGATAQFGNAPFASAHGIVGSLGASRTELGRESSIGNNLSSAVTALPEPGEVPSTHYRSAVNPDALRYCEDTFSGQVSYVKLIEINMREFCGHVFNLSTDSGMYLANTIVAHNCDCGCDYRKSSDSDDEE